MKLLILVLFILTVTAFYKQAQAASIHRVIRIKDGDTIVTKDSNNRYHTIRLEAIDAPESDQAYGKQSTEALYRLITGKMIRVVAKKRKDYHGRTVARLFLKNIDINNEMVKLGAAWVEPRYARGRIFAKYYVSERRAKRDKKGLWGLSHPIPPWVWRRIN